MGLLPAASVPSYLASHQPASWEETGQPHLSKYAYNTLRYVKFISNVINSFFIEVLQVVSPDSLIFSKIGEEMFIEVCSKESNPRALGGKKCCLHSWELLQCSSFNAIPIPFWEQKRCGKGRIPYNTIGGTHAWDSSEAQAEFTHSPDFPITPMLSLIFQISSKPKHQDIFVLMRNPTARGGQTPAGEKSKLKVFSWK